MVNEVRKVINWKPEHCIEALQSLACYANYDQCVETETGEVETKKVCDDACEASASYCNVTSHIIGCSSFPVEDCFEAPVIHGLPCAVPPKLPFCSMISYNSSRTYHGEDFMAIDRVAEGAYKVGSEELPTQRYVQ